MSDEKGKTMDTVASRRGVVAGVFGALAGALDLYDVVCLAGLVLLAVGLGLWVSLGVALTVAGGLVLLLGVAGAAATKRAVPVVGEPVDTPSGG